MKINDDELEIFSRQLILKEFDEKKFNKLQKKTISVIGIGGIGCPIVQYLVSCGIKNLNIYDDDIIKKNNLNRQTLFGIEDIGYKKVIIARKKLLAINPYLRINSLDCKIDNKNVDRLKKSSIIVDATDNWNTMHLINKYAVENKIPLLSASAAGYNIQVILFENKKNKHLCLQCIFPNKKEIDIARCDTIGILGTTAGLAGIISAQKIINFLMNFNDKTNILTLIDSKTLSLSHIKSNNNSSCKLI